MIQVTQTFLPPLAEYQSYLERIWESKWLTNRGALLKELEEKLIQHLGVSYLTITTNGTLPLQLAIKAMQLEGEIITTPFSYVATVSSIIWEHATPVFVDIDPLHWTIDETKIEAAITPNTKAILVTHVFGNPCAVETIEAIAAKHNMSVVYDAAHCFGVRYKGDSIFNWGDVSTCSFHATKLFHTGEGGCWITKNETLHQKLFYHHNFGHNGPLDFHGLGINAKTSELQAAMGLAVFNHLDEILASRKAIVEQYQQLLSSSTLQFMVLREHTDWNYHYFPVAFQQEAQLLRVQHALNQEHIFPRRYFCPSLNKLPYLQAPEMPVAESLASRILCLPLYVGLSARDVERISSILLSNLSE